MTNEANDDQPNADRMRGCRHAADVKRQATVERLKDAIATLEAQGQPISARTIQAISGMEYNSYGRNPEARALFQRHSTALKQRPQASAVIGMQLPLLGRGRSRHVAEDPARETVRLEREMRKLQATVNRLETEVQRLQPVEAQYHLLLQERLQLEMKVARLEVDLVKYRGYTRTITNAPMDDHIN